MIVNKYYVVEVMTPEIETAAISLGACAILVGVPESLKEIAESENWSLPHLWVEEFSNPEVGPEDVV